MTGGPEGVDGDAAGRTLVTLDGPAGVGKSTTAREVARRLGWRYLDSGALYRAVTWALLEERVPESEWEALTSEDLHALGLSVRSDAESLTLLHRGRPLDAELRTPEVTAAVSAVARLPAVRGWLLDTQREAGREGRLVSDGRDMGTVVFPQAATKIYLEADPTERARRRLGDRGIGSPTAGQVTEERLRLQERDQADMQRQLSPLRPAEDALRLDTTRLSFEQQVLRIVQEARRSASE